MTTGDDAIHEYECPCCGRQIRISGINMRRIARAVALRYGVAAAKGQRGEVTVNLGRLPKDWSDLTGDLTAAQITSIVRWAVEPA